MPTYEYACKECGEHLEVVQSFKDDPLTTCPSCGGALRKVFGSIGIAFRGSGFYKTDSRSSTGKSEKSEKKAASGDGGSSSSEKSSSSSDSAAKSGDKAAKSGDKAAKTSAASA